MSDSATAAPLRVLIASDAPIVSAGLRVVLRALEIPVAGIAQRPELFVEAARKKRANVALLAPSAGLSSEMGNLLDSRPNWLSILMLLAPTAVKVHSQAMHRGTLCLPSTASPAEIGNALRACALAPGCLPVVAQRLCHGIGGRLTPREQDILDCLVKGQQNLSIARSLGISEATVKAHLTSVYRKLGASNRTETISAYLGVSP